MSLNTKKISTENKTKSQKNAPRFKTQFSFFPIDDEGEYNPEPSKTIPDQNLSMKQLLLNHTRGLGVDAKHYEGQYFEDQTIPVITDLTDFEEMRTDLKNRQTDIETQIREMEASNELEKPKPIPVQETPETPPTPPQKEK